MADPIEPIEAVKADDLATLRFRRIVDRVLYLERQDKLNAVNDPLEGKDGKVYHH